MEELNKRGSRAFWDGIARAIRLPQNQLSKAELAQRTALVPGTAPGSAMVPDDAASVIVDLCQTYGAYETLNLIPLDSGKSRVPYATAEGTAEFHRPASQAQITPIDITGSGVTAECNLVVALIDVSLGVIEDSKADLGVLLPRLAASGLAARLDHGAFAADGSDDTTDGGYTGIFAHGDVPSVTAGAGGTLVESLVEEDLLNTIDAVAGRALQRGCRWWIHPDLYKKLLRSKDGSGAPMIKFPAGEPVLCGWPISLVAAAPSTNAAGQKVLAFGCGDAYAISIRKNLEVTTSDMGRGFNFGLNLFRVLMRADCRMLDASWFATLKLSAN